jgi:putative selenium metabolism protein SsnA
MKFVDARGGVIMPGLINAHHHIYSAFARGMSVEGYAPRSFPEILEGLWWKLDSLLNLEDCYYSAMATYLDCIKNGVTTVFDHHASYGATPGSLDEISRAAHELGVRTCLCYEVSDRNGKEKMLQAVEENEAFLKASRDDPMQKGMMGLHAAFTLSDETLSLCRERMTEGAGVHIHVAEGIEDVYDSLRKHGKKIVNRLFDFGLLGEKSIAVHCVHIAASEMEILRETGTMVVHNPESNMGNAVGCPPTMEMLRRGVLAGLGTDGYTSDMLESYKVANILHKHHLCDPGAAWAEVPKMLFENNAVIAGRYFASKPGALVPGAAADVIVLDYNPLTPMRGDNVNGHILFGMNGRNVVTTVINGEIKMQDREVLCADEAEIMAKCRVQAGKLADRMNGR